MHRHELDPEDAAALLSLADADQLLTESGIRAPAVRLVRDGTVLSERDHTRSATLAGRPLTGLIDVRRALEAFTGGATVVFQGLQRYWPPLTRLVAALEAELGHPCQANAYLTPAGGQGFAVHADTHDVIVIQTSGTKTWQLHDDPGSEPDDAAAREGQSDIEARSGIDEVVLRAGSTLYLPTGTRHSARAQSGVSLHITIGINQFTTHQVLRAAVDRALTSVPDDHLPAGLLDVLPETAEDLAGQLDLLATALRAVDAADLLQARIRGWLSSGPSRLAGGLLDAAALDSLTGDTVLRRRPNHPFLVQAHERDADRLVLLLGDRRLDLPAWLRPALDQIGHQDSLRPNDLDLDEVSRLVLCRRLVREGLLTVDR